MDDMCKWDIHVVHGHLCHCSQVSGKVAAVGRIYMQRAHESFSGAGSLHTKYVTIGAFVLQCDACTLLAPACMMYSGEHLDRCARRGSVAV